jgi:filamentous hemagglutinin
MYNLTVDEAHTFFVGEGQWLVHNVDCSGIVSRGFKPGGSLQVLPGRFTESEMDAALALSQQGNSVTIRAATGQGRLSDLVINGVEYDVYTPQSGTSVDNILRAMLGKDTQATGIVLDMRNVGNLGYSEAGLLTRLRELGARNINDIVILGGRK